MKLTKCCSCTQWLHILHTTPAATSGVVVPDTVTVLPAYRTNRMSRLDAIHRLPLVQEVVVLACGSVPGQVVAANPGGLGLWAATPTPSSMFGGPEM